MTSDQHQHSHDDDLACVAFVELVTDYLEGALPDTQARRLERHLGTCAGCTEYLEQLRAVAGSLRGLTDESFPAEMRDGVIADFKRSRNP
jgi:anti-sigma factor RsiW